MKKLSDCKHWEYHQKRQLFKRGKYAGVHLEKIPTDYLVWFVKSGYKHMENRRAWAEEELKRRANV